MYPYSICLVCYWLQWRTDTFVLYVTDYTGGRIHLSCMLLTTQEDGYIYLVCYWLHGARIHSFCMLLTTLKYGYICLVCYWLHWSTDIFVLYCSWPHGVRIYCLVCYGLHWSTDTFVLYDTDYTGVRIHLSCMLLTTLEYEYQSVTYKTNVSVLQCSQ
jgi:hypothetical protein